LPVSQIVCELWSWLDTTTTTSPVPISLGSTVTRPWVITAVSCTGSGGRGLFWKSSLRQPVAASASSAPTTNSGTF
jgi:hypothetical protein